MPHFLQPIPFLHALYLSLLLPSTGCGSVHSHASEYRAAASFKSFPNTFNLLELNSALFSLLFLLLFLFLLLLLFLLFLLLLFLLFLLPLFLLFLLLLFQLNSALFNLLELYSALGCVLRHDLTDLILLSIGEEGLAPTIPQDSG